MDWTIPCKQAATLMVAREDRPLDRRERTALRWHLLLCKACTRFEGQMLTMRHALDGWRHYREAELSGGDASEPAAQAPDAPRPPAGSA